MRGEGERVALSRRTPRTAPRPDRSVARRARRSHSAGLHNERASVRTAIS